MIIKIEVDDLIIKIAMQYEMEYGEIPKKYTKKWVKETTKKYITDFGYSSLDHHTVELEQYAAKAELIYNSLNFKLS